MRNAVPQFGREGAIVGSDVWITTIVIPPFGKVDVQVATTVPGGTIRAAGTLTATQMTGSFRVVGGTGRYASARGALSLGNFICEREPRCDRVPLATRVGWSYLPIEERELEAGGLNLMEQPPASRAGAYQAAVSNVSISTQRAIW